MTVSDGAAGVGPDDEDERRPASGARPGGRTGSADAQDEGPGARENVPLGGEQRPDAVAGPSGTDRNGCAIETTATPPFVRVR